MRTFDETDAETREYADTYAPIWGGVDLLPMPLTMRPPLPCIASGEHDWWHVAGHKKGVVELKDGRITYSHDLEEHDECAYCGIWQDQAAFWRDAERVGMTR